MTSLHLRSRVAWTAPVMLVLPFLMGADGSGCAPGGVIAIGGGEDGGGMVAEGGAGADAGSTCTPASCAGQAAPALAKLCPDGTTLTENLCEEQADGKCGWGFPACPATDACEALPCVGCPYGDLGVGTDPNGCPTCPICAPAPDAGKTTDACPPAPICNLPNCMYGVIPQKDASGCDVCAVCAPPPDAGSCSCGAPPPVASCPGGVGTRSVTCESTSAKTCSWVIGACPTPDDAGSTMCMTDSECPSGKVCGFLETNSCGTPGMCFPAPMVICNAYSPGCACDGSEVDIICNGLPSGYVRKPIKHTGACVDGG